MEMRPGGFTDGKQLIARQTHVPIPESSQGISALALSIMVSQYRDLAKDTDPFKIAVQIPLHQPLGKILRGFFGFLEDYSRSPSKVRRSEYG
jgi:hypothetical protein